MDCEWGRIQDYLVQWSFMTQKKEDMGEEHEGPLVGVSLGKAKQKSLWIVNTEV